MNRILIVAEHDGERLSPSVARCVRCARDILDAEIHVLVLATSPDLSIGARDELMRDLVHAVIAPAGTGAGEIARLRDELRDREETRRWIERVTPTLLSRFEHVVQGHDATAEDEAAHEEAEAEREAHAEEEANAAEKSHVG